MFLSNSSTAFDSKRLEKTKEISVTNIALRGLMSRAKLDHTRPQAGEPAPGIQPESKNQGICHGAMKARRFQTPPVEIVTSRCENIDRPSPSSPGVSRSQPIAPCQSCRLRLH